MTDIHRVLELNGAPTEQRNLRTIDIDTQPTIDVLRMISLEDHRVPAAVAVTCVPCPALSRSLTISADCDGF